MKPVSVLSALLAATSVVLVVSEMPARAFNLGMAKLSDRALGNMAGRIGSSVVDSGNKTVQLNFTNPGTLAPSTTGIYPGKGKAVSNRGGNLTAIVNTSGDSFLRVADSHPLSTGNFEGNARVQAKTIVNKPDIVDKPNVKEKFSNPLNEATSFRSIQDSFLRERSIALGQQVQNVSSTVDNSWAVSNPIVEPVPEPLTILGTGIAFGFGGFLKREYDKKKAKVGIKD